MHVLLSLDPSDTVSYRQRDRGSILIQYVVDVFNTYACTDEIDKLFTKVRFTSVKYESIPRVFVLMR